MNSNQFFSPHLSRNEEKHDVEPQDFDNVEDMLFEVFRCEETDTIDSISICQFLKVSKINYLPYEPAMLSRRKLSGYPL